MSPNVTHATRCHATAKKTDLEVFEPTMWEKEARHIWWSGNKNSDLIRKRIRDARYTRQKNIAQAFILERYFFVSICPAANHGTCLAVFLAAVLPLC